MIALLCPTRGRPKQFKCMCDSVMATAKTPISIHCCSNGDDDYVERVAPDMPTVQMWNDLAERAALEPKTKLFMLAADDIIFTTPGWDEVLLDHYNKLTEKIHVYHLQDSRDPEGTPHPIVTREYMDVMGYFIPPLFLHWYCDTWTREIAGYSDVFTHLKDYMLVHDKPSDKGQSDETHNRIRMMGWHARDTYVNDTCKHLLGCEKQRLQKRVSV